MAQETQYCIFTYSLGRVYSTNYKSKAKTKSIKSSSSITTQKYAILFNKLQLSMKSMTKT
jgi:hypothetical protein